MWNGPCNPLQIQHSKSICSRRQLRSRHRSSDTLPVLCSNPGRSTPPVQSLPPPPLASGTTQPTNKPPCDRPPKTVPGFLILLRLNSHLVNRTRPCFNFARRLNLLFSPIQSAVIHLRLTRHSQFGLDCSTSAQIYSLSGSFIFLVRRSCPCFTGNSSGSSPLRQQKVTLSPSDV